MKKLVGLIAGALFLAGAAPAQSNRGANRPVVVEAESFPALLNYPVASLRMLASQAEEFQVIPFQIDERLEVSVYQTWTRRRDYLAYATNTGPEPRADYDPNFDANDQIAFMTRDLGEEVPPAQWPTGARACAELQVADDAAGVLGFAYLCAFDQPPSLSPRRYVDADESGRVFSGESYRMGFPERSPINFDRLEILGPEGASPNLVDRLKTRFDIAVGWGLSAYSLTEDDFTYYVRGIKLGPIRNLVETESVLESWSNAQIRVINTVTFYSDHVEFLLNTRPPGYWGPVNLSTFMLALDLNSQADSMTLISEKNPQGAMVDGTLEAEELKLNYGPNEWTAVTGKAGTILSYLALPRDAPLQKDLYYNDQANKPDPPENQSGMFGKFGFTLRHLEKIGGKPQPFRLVYWFSPDAYRPGMEKPGLDSYRRPLQVISGTREMPALRPSVAPAADTRALKDQPIPTAKEKPEEQKVTRQLLPNFWLDYYNVGYGGGPSYEDHDLFGTGTKLKLMAVKTDRNFQWYQFEISKIPGLEFLEDFSFFVEYQGFPSESFSGQGNATPKDHRSLYWWEKYEGSITFSKHFADHYCLDTEASYRDMTIHPGQKARSGGIIYDRVEEHFGFDPELTGERWGAPAYGRQGGLDNRLKLNLSRDFRDDFQVPHRGNYQELGVEFVNPIIGSDYNFTRLFLDLRGYLEPRWLNHLPMDEWFSSRRTLLSKFYGAEKRRSLAGRLGLIHLLSPELEFGGRGIRDVPFYDLTPLGGSDDLNGKGVSFSNLRGFFDDRFRDNDAAWINLEYRWAWWKFLDAALFLDTGIVMNNLFESESWSTPWHFGYGFVLRIHVPPAVLATFDFGYSVEEQNYLHQPNSAF